MLLSVYTIPKIYTLSASYNVYHHQIYKSNHSKKPGLILNYNTPTNVPLVATKFCISNLKKN